jgi:hypothetical protein
LIIHDGKNERTTPQKKTRDERENKGNETGSVAGVWWMVHLSKKKKWSVFLKRKAKKKAVVIRINSSPTPSTKTKALLSPPPLSDFFL